MIEPPFELAGINVESNGRICVVGCAVARATASAHPGLGLRDAPVGHVQIEVDAACDPGVAARAEEVRELAPGIAARIFSFRDGVEAPEFLAGLRIIGADEAFLFAILIARSAAEALNDLAFGNDG